MNFGNICKDRKVAPVQGVQDLINIEGVLRGLGSTYSSEEIRGGGSSIFREKRKQREMKGLAEEAAR